MPTSSAELAEKAGFIKQADGEEERNIRPEVAFCEADACRGKSMPYKEKLNRKVDIINTSLDSFIEPDSFVLLYVHGLDFNYAL